jgi:hypothetical protein
VPSWQEYQAAKNRQWVRSILSAFSRMPSHKGRPTLSEENRALLEGDNEEQRKRDRDIIVRYEDAHGVGHDRDALAEKARLRLRDVGRSSE